MKKILIFLLLILTTTILADDQNRVVQILAVGKEISATDKQVACAIADGCTPEEFIARVMGKIKLIAPDEAPKGSPVLISVEGMPEKVAELWRRYPVQPTDVWLQLYDRNGKRVNIFWSANAGPRTFELIIAENGPEVPTLGIATHYLQYGKSLPPVTSIPEPDTPSAELQKLVVSVMEIEILDTGDLLNLTEFYFDFADIVRRDGLASEPVITTTTMFRNVYMKAGTLVFQQTGMKGKYENLNETIDNIISNYIGLNVGPLDATKTADVLNAIAWALYQEIK